MIFGNYHRRQRSASAVPIRMLQHAGASSTCGTFVPEDGGPTAIVIGAAARREALANLARRHGLEVSALETFARQQQ